MLHLSTASRSWRLAARQSLTRGNLLSPRSGPPRTRFSTSSTLAAPAPVRAAFPLFRAAAVAFVPISCLSLSHVRSSECAAAVVRPTAVVRPPSAAVSSSSVSFTTTIVRKLKRFWRLLKYFVRVGLRALFLSSIALPLASTYHVSRLRDDWKDMWLRAVVQGVELSGAAVIKLCQWASSRPDLFGVKFSETFGRFQDSTSPHSIKVTKRTLTEAYGPDWEKFLKLDEKVVGSGCIGQVYKGTILQGPNAGKTVAVKVLHPSIAFGIKADLDIMRGVAWLLNKWDTTGKTEWINVGGMVEEFAGLLSFQLDLRTEAENLKTFSKNFEGNKRVRFPNLVKEFEPRQKVLIEEFIVGKTLAEFIREQGDNSSLREELCDIGIGTVCKMIFEDNFVHGDLHPGNVLFTRDPKTGVNGLVLLDAGIAKRFTRHDYDLLVGTLTSFIRNDGGGAADWLIKDSVHRLNYPPRDVDEFRGVLRDMAIDARKNPNYFDSLSNYLNQICDSAAEHHIQMNQSFVSIALTIRVMEGLALALNPSAVIWRIANTIILRVEAEKAFFGDDRFAPETANTPDIDDW